MKLKRKKLKKLLFSLKFIDFNAKMATYTTIYYNIALPKNKET